MIGKFPLEISSLYCLTTFMTLSPHYLVTFIILSLFINEETLFFPVIIGTGFGSGFSPFAPGTAGALLAVLIWFGISFIVSEICLIWLTVALILFFTVMGVWATNCLEPFWGRGPVTGGGGRNGRSVDCIAGSTVWKCLVCVGGFCPLSSV